MKNLLEAILMLLCGIKVDKRFQGCNRAAGALLRGDTETVVRVMHGNSSDPEYNAGVHQACADFAELNLNSTQLRILMDRLLAGMKA